MSKERADFRKTLRDLEKTLYPITNSVGAIDLLKFITSLVQKRIRANDQKTAEEFNDKIEGPQWPN